MTDNKFTIGSQWKTRGGWRAVVVTNPDYAYKIAVWHDSGMQEARLHHLDGTCFFDKSEFELIEPWVEPRKIKISKWINVYADQSVFNLYPTKEIADRYAASSRIACVYHEFEVTEGDGL